MLTLFCKESDNITKTVKRANFLIHRLSSSHLSIVIPQCI